MKRAFLAFCLALALPVAAHADYPDRPLKLIVPFPPGSGTDTVATGVSNVTLFQKLPYAYGSGSARVAWCEQRDAAKRKA